MHYYPLAFKLEECVGIYNTPNDLSSIVCILKKTKDLNIHVSNMTTEKNESKILTKYITCEWKCRFDGEKYISNLWWNNDKCVCECKKRSVCEKNYIWNPATCSFQNRKYEMKM